MEHSPRKRPLILVSWPVHASLQIYHLEKGRPAGKGMPPPTASCPHREAGTHNPACHVPPALHAMRRTPRAPPALPCASHPKAGASRQAPVPRPTCPTLLAQLTILEPGPLRCRLGLEMALSPTSRLKQTISLTAVATR